MRVAGAHVLLTGATGDIGRRLATHLSDAGARLTLVARSTQPLEALAADLGAHAVPPEFDGRADDYIDAVCDWLPRLHAEGLVDAVDAFCEGIGFSPAQTRRVPKPWL